MKPKGQGKKRMPLDFIVEEKNILAFSRLSFIWHLDLEI